MGRTSSLRFLVFLAALLAALAARAASFSEQLSPTDRAAAGFTHLDATQVKALDALIDRDVTAARQGDVVAFAKSFTDRRTAEERQRVGIDTLSAAERAQLDRCVAAAIAARPVLPVVASSWAPDVVHQVTVVPPKAEVHGEVSLFYGQSSRGRSWYGGSFDGVVIDPSHRVAIGVGYTEVHSSGGGRGGRDCW